MSGEQARTVGRSGIILIDKPRGLTSHDVVARVRKAAGTRKVGHAGTLDPMATGLLTIGLNSSTRLLTYLVGLDKEYTATIRLGQATTTDDAEGDVVSTAVATGLGDEEIEAAIAALRGEILQVPSSVSAIKVDGERAYARVRAGESIELAPRSVHIGAFEVVAVTRGDFVDLDVRVECSSGTYIRALARDLGSALGVGGHLTALRRTRVGPFSVDDAAALESLDPAARLLDPAVVAAVLFPTISLDAAQVLELMQGKRPSVAGAADASPVAALDEAGRLAGIVELAGGRVRTLVNFPTDEVLQ